MCRRDGTQSGLRSPPLLWVFFLLFRILSVYICLCSLPMPYTNSNASNPMHTMALCHRVRPRTMSWWSKFQGCWTSVGCLLGHFAYSAKRGPGMMHVLHRSSSAFCHGTYFTYATCFAAWKSSATHVPQHCETPSLGKLEFNLHRDWGCVCIITNVIRATVSVQCENYMCFLCVFYLCVTM